MLTQKGCEHIIAEEHAALRVMLAGIDSKLKARTLLEANVYPSSTQRASVRGSRSTPQLPVYGKDDPQERDDYRDRLIS